MLAEVQRALTALIAPTEPLLIGVSGGPDSVALLDVLVTLGWRPHVCHLNHQWRGAASAADAEFVRALATRWGLPLHVASRQVPHDEDAARRARQDFFAAVAQETGIGTLALAHTEDDLVETFLLRLLRGAGPTGLAGIWPERQFGAVRVIRPLLGVRRADVEAYLRARGLEARADASNEDRQFARNRVRHELLPLLERDYNPALRDTLARAAAILREEDGYLAGYVATTVLPAVRRGDALDRAALAGWPVALQRRVLRAWLAGTEPGFDHLEAVRRLALGGATTGEVCLPAGLVIVREYDRLRQAAARGAPAADGPWPLSVPGTTIIPALATKLVCQVIQVVGHGPGREWFDAAALGPAPVVRRWRAGDRFQPLGMRGEKKLQDFFVDEKVPRRERERVPLLCATDGRIAWVVGHRIAEPFKVTTATRTIWRIQACAL